MFIRACLIGEKFAGSKALESLGQTVAENRPIRDSSPFSPHIWHSGSPVKNAEARRRTRVLSDLKYSDLQGFGEIGRKACDCARLRT